MEIRPGYLTTEFWTTLLTNVVSAAVAIAAIFHRSVDNLTPLIGLASMLAAGISTALYNHSRATVKATALIAHTEAATPHG